MDKIYTSYKKSYTLVLVVKFYKQNNFYLMAIDLVQNRSIILDSMIEKSNDNQYKIAKINLIIFFEQIQKYFE